MQKLIVIPARGGSKGIPWKNIYPLNGKPLLEYTLDVLLEAGLEDTDIVVSTDSEKIKQVASRYPNIFIVDRPPEISGDLASTESALLHALDVMEARNGKAYDAILTLQATSPMRKAETLKRFVEQYERMYPEFDAQLSLNENRADFWIASGDGKFERLFKNAPRRRQDRDPLYVENSAYYITDIQALRATNSVLGTRPNGFLISDVEALDINEPWDIEVAQLYLSKRSPQRLGGLS